MSRQWQERLTYAALSVFLAWHTLALMFAPMPDSALTEPLGGLLHPYLTLLRLNNTWGFYAPEVGSGQQFRYVVEDATGKEHTFIPTEDFSWFHPAFWWIRAWHKVIIESPDEFGDQAAALFCKKHASLNPISITLIQVLQDDFPVEDQLAGKHPMDAQFVSVNTLKRVKCSGN
jgi:hypothetical protein